MFISETLYCLNSDHDDCHNLFKFKFVLVLHNVYSKNKIDIYYKIDINYFKVS